MAISGLSSVRRAFDNVGNETNNKLRAAYITWLSATVIQTPVHTVDGGRLRNSWYLTKDRPSNAKGRSANTSGSSSITDIATMPQWLLGEKIYLTNPLPYANVVEYGGYPIPVKQGSYIDGQYQVLSVNGYSKQAPNGMVRINLQRLQKQVRNL